jgi:PIN domain nuclease of toxin-antitoxin system
VIAAVADTHTVVWSVLNDPRLSLPARSAIRQAEAAGDVVGVSSMTLVELVYLVDKRRFDGEIVRRVSRLLSSGLVFIEVPVDRLIALAMENIPRHEVPDMPDRVIAATAVHLNVPPISRDGKIRVSSVTTIW